MSDIIVPKIVLYEGKEFYKNRTDKALNDCVEAGFQAVFMPQLIDTRIQNPKDSRAWQTWWTTPSIKATGLSKGGNPVVVYAHTDNYFSNPKNIETAINNGLRNGAGVMPQANFQRLLDLEDGKTVFVVDYNKLKNSVSGIISVDDALKHPQTIPFISGKEKAETYLNRHLEVYGANIGIWHSDDLQADETPAGRLLFLGGYGKGLFGYYDLINLGRFLGAPKTAAEGGALKKSPNKK